MSDFEYWWENEGQYNRAGGSDYEKTFAWEAWNHQQNKIDTLEKKMSKALDYLDGKTEETWKFWKEKADMMDQGASNAYEDAYWFVKNTVEDKGSE